MRLALRISLLAIGLASWLGAATGRAGALVEFPNVSEQAPAKLLGYLARSDAGLSALLGGNFNRAAPYPAVVVLHGCGGVSSYSAQIADKLGSWGYVALTVDSLGPRGIASRCGSMSFDQAFDAYAALRYLSKLDFVDPARVAVLGQSMGGSAALRRRSRQGRTIFQRALSRRDRLLPELRHPGGLDDSANPGPDRGGDDWNPAERCREMVAHSRPDGARIALTIYPGAYHAFDVAQLKPGIRSLGHWLEYNETAARVRNISCAPFSPRIWAGYPRTMTARC